MKQKVTFTLTMALDEETQEDNEELAQEICGELVEVASNGGTYKANCNFELG